MKTSLRWLYAITLASFLLQPAWQNGESSSTTRSRVLWVAFQAEAAAQASDFTLDEESETQKKEHVAKQQKQVSTLLVLLLAACEFTVPEPKMLGRAADVVSVPDRDAPSARHLIRGPPVQA